MNVPNIPLVFELSLQGKTVEQIATKLKLSESTIYRLKRTDDYKALVKEYKESCLIDIRFQAVKDNDKYNRDAQMVYERIIEHIKSDNSKISIEAIKVFNKLKSDTVADIYANELEELEDLADQLNHD
ncbi:MAG TPA: helix-turn-helix domain-containing protein [Coleofasciculaceae cyanobacterium]|jgi:IS30 family transposase